MNIYGGLLFNQGHVQDPATARMLADASGAAAPPVQAQRPPPAAGTRQDAARLAQARGVRGGVELWAALLAAFR
ncbi:hypothetical protein [Luteimonas sp. SDU82]|uniref:hypothetical protein n=1 Tax=Luteimonas sp. SDU82 TaxID=3422592 RepID=UPI003EBF7899